MTAKYDPKYDLNGDGIIDEADFEIFKRYYFHKVADDPEAAVADFNGDGIVNALDYSDLFAHMGAVREPPTEKKTWLIPSLVVGGLALLAIVSAKRKK